MIKIFKAIALLTLSFCLPAWASKEIGNGGDECENRIEIIRKDIESWIVNGGSSGLDLSVTPNVSSIEEYNTRMLEALFIKTAEVDNKIIKTPTTQVKCVDHKILLNDEPKTCINVPDRGLIKCNISRFNKTNESFQYTLIHHEYAGIAKMEPNFGPKSNLSISNQISEFLIDFTVKKLSIKRPEARRTYIENHSIREHISYINFKKLKEMLQNLGEMDKTNIFEVKSINDTIELVIRPSNSGHARVPNSDLLILNFEEKSDGGMYISMMKGSRVQSEDLILIEDQLCGKEFDNFYYCPQLSIELETHNPYKSFFKIQVVGIHSESWTSSDPDFNEYGFSLSYFHNSDGKDANWAVSGWEEDFDSDDSNYSSSTYSFTSNPLSLDRHMIGARVQNFNKKDNIRTTISANCYNISCSLLAFKTTVEDGQDLRKKSTLTKMVSRKYMYDDQNKVSVVPMFLYRAIDHVQRNKFLYPTIQWNSKKLRRKVEENIKFLINLESRGNLIEVNDIQMSGVLNYLNEITN